MKFVDISIRYLHYILNSINKFDVHPPFLYDLITSVFEDKTVYPDYQKVESLKKQLMDSKEIISVSDLGAGSKTEKGNKRQIGRIAKSSSKPKKYGRLLHRFVKNFKPTEVLELGTSLGLSTAYMALGNPATKIVSIEGCPNISSKAFGNLNKLNISNFELITGSFDEQLPAYLETIEKVDFVFFDGNHQKQPTINYFEQCLSKTTNNTVFIFDDIHWSRGMEEAWNYICAHSSSRLTIDIFAMGIVFFKKDLTKQHFVIRF